MQQFDIPIVHKTYELYREIHALQSIIPKMERYTLWQRCENTALRVLEDFIRVGYLPLEARGAQLIATSA